MVPPHAVMNHPSMVCYMPKPSGVIGLQTGQRQRTQASQPLGGWASLLLLSPSFPLTASSSTPILVFPHCQS